MCKNVSDITKILANEGFEMAHRHLNAPTLKKQLKQAIAAG
jgi:hypothetical protein